MAYRATIKQMDTGTEAIVFPRTRKTTLFPSIAAATKALDARSKRINANGFVGRVYEIDHSVDDGRRLVFTMAL